MATRPTKPINEIGAPRTHSGGAPQKYTLDDAGRRLIKERFDGSSERTNEIHEAFGVPHRVVREWARRMGVAPQSGREWTPKEVRYLTNYIREKTFEEIAEHLDRSRSAVRIKAHKMGLLKERAGYTMKDFCDGFGCSFDVATRWITRGWLKGKRREATGFWDFSDKNIRDFIVAHPYELKPEKVDLPWIIDIVAGDNGVGNLMSRYIMSEESEEDAL
jgi:hypothetical protein